MVFGANTHRAFARMLAAGSPTPNRALLAAGLVDRVQLTLAAAPGGP